jgi:uncharacterized repeat protein (TIGR03833 family)
LPDTKYTRIFDLLFFFICLKVGAKVLVVQKQDQRSGKLTEGIVQKLLTNSQIHPRGIKVMLEGGIVGRVKEIK